MTANPPSSPEDRHSGEKPEVTNAKSLLQPSSERREEKKKELSGSEERESAEATKERDK
jgi:hypothetical protein